MEYKNREELIRHHWSRWGHKWNIGTSPFLRVPVRHQAVTARHDTNSKANPEDNLEFAFETGTYKGIPSWRVVCEGVVVEYGPILDAPK